MQKKIYCIYKRKCSYSLTGQKRFSLTRLPCTGAQQHFPCCRLEQMPYLSFASYPQGVLSLRLNPLAVCFIGVPSSPLKLQMDRKTDKLINDDRQIGIWIDRQIDKLQLARQIYKKINDEQMEIYTIDRLIDG